MIISRLRAQTIQVAAIVLLLTVSVHAAAKERFVSRLTLPSGQTAVVAEGDFEARSIGSFSIRLYKAAKPPNETTFFTSGLVRPRDGTINKVVLADVDGDGRKEIVVVVHSVGTGGYLSAQAFAIAGDRLVFRGAVEGLARDDNPVAALRRSMQRREKSREK